MPRLVSIDNFSPDIAKAGSVNDWLLLERVPTIFASVSILRNIVTNINVLMVRDRLPLEVHVNQNIVTMPNQSPGVNISIDLRILGKPGIDDVLSREFRFVFIESIRYKHRNIVAPSVSRRCR